jgi:hypothetical protein
MAEERPELADSAEQEEGEVQSILSALRDLAGRATSPVVRACLEQAAEDIAHLTGSGDRREDQDAGQATG